MGESEIKTAWDGWYRNYRTGKLIAAEPMGLRSTTDKSRDEDLMYNAVCLICKDRSVWSQPALIINRYRCRNGCARHAFYLDGVATPEKLPRQTAKELTPDRRSTAKEPGGNVRITNSDGCYNVKLKSFEIELLGSEGRITPDDFVHKPHHLSFHKDDLEDLMVAFNWLYHETKEKA